MRFPTPIDERRRRGIPKIAVVLVAAAAAAVGGIVWAVGRSDDSTASSDTSPADPGDGAPSLDSGDLSAALSVVPDPIVLFDGVVSDGAPNTVTVTGRDPELVEQGLVLLSVAASADDSEAEFAVRPCGGDDASASAWPVGREAVERHVLVPVGVEGSVCVTSTATTSATIELDGFVVAETVSPFPAPVRVVDTTAEGDSADGEFVGIGVRPERSTLRVPMAARFSGLDEAGALVVSVTAVDPLDAGEVAVFAPEAAVPAAAALEYEPGVTGHATSLVRLGESGELCVSTTGRTDLVVDVLGLAPASAVDTITPDDAAADGCPGQTLFPDRRIVALYGTQRSARLGVLGEQPPEEAAERLAEIAEPWRAGDRPVLPAFELIATLATGTPEDRGVYNIRSTPEFVQEYLDVARRHGYYLILDLQTGQSDFLTEAKYYEDFLRQPDVGLALDPEWRTAPPARPRGGLIGTVDAAEVNEVIEYVAQIVAEEDLPEKLVVLHQFEPGMITNRDQIVELPGVAINLHMDGFGPRPEKLNSYDVVRAEPPWNMGLKLFYDEDTDLLAAADVLDGELFDPVPDLITYQ